MKLNFCYESTSANLDSQNQAKNIPLVLSSSPIKILGKQRLQLYICRYKDFYTQKHIHTAGLGRVKSTRMKSWKVFVFCKSTFSISKIHCVLKGTVPVISSDPPPQIAICRGTFSIPFPEKGWKSLVFLSYFFFKSASGIDFAVQTMKEKGRIYYFSR